MSSNRSNSVTNSIGIVIPKQVNAIVKDHNERPERGRLMDRITLQRKRKRNEASAANKKQRTERRTADITSSNQFKFTSSTTCGTPRFTGTVAVCSTDNPDKVDKCIECIGYMVSLHPKDKATAIIVLDITGRGMIPCLCPTHFLDDATIEEGHVSMKGYYDKKKDMFCRAYHDIEFPTVAVYRAVGVEEVRGYLLVDGKFKGRVVDSKMMSSIEAGCLRIGAHSNQAFYTLSRTYSISREELKVNAHVILDTTTGIRLCKAARADVDKLVNWGELAIDGRLSNHQTKAKAICALDRASRLPQPSISERVLQVSIGGNPDNMVVGKFLPCQGLCENPNVDIRCACGFVACDEEDKERVRSLLRRRCGK